jgi:hypothetical protein
MGTQAPALALGTPPSHQPLYASSTLLRCERKCTYPSTTNRANAALRCVFLFLFPESILISVMLDTICLGFLWILVLGER